ncbi:TetR/AcrR family transcriptional regulator [Mechercharimyces sp. CAU 1602]|uniref:TetR/AcrR family transcriptional regulator n=1 Tax=Mechercharimyces sp. CAU 1602 TaxID=2973933 RepID=UPI002161B513|nr:TetR/AcrR family transcriptional regulator [Mechercharimyces sp. CAU 1602]MCS1352719.1 TetR/AcrR family transcriptional regulator [Mechercharimyces sp. CAU 1602]
MSHETIEQIYIAAVEVFAESGFDQAKMDVIAKRAGVAKGTIYYHFTSKEELFVAMMDQGLEALTDRVRRRIASKPSARMKIEKLIYTQIEFFFEHNKFARLLLSEVWGSAKRQHDFRMHIREYVALIEEVLILGIEDRSFKKLNTVETSFSIFGAISVAVLQELLKQPQRGAEVWMNEAAPRLVETLETLILSGIETK